MVKSTLFLVGPCPGNNDWEKAGGWSDEELPSFYMSFDDTYCLAFYNGALQTTNGKVIYGMFYVCNNTKLLNIKFSETIKY